MKMIRLPRHIILLVGLLCLSGCAFQKKEIQAHIRIPKETFVQIQSGDMQTQSVSPLSVVGGVASAASSYYTFRQNEVDPDTIVIKITVFKSDASRKLTFNLGDKTFFRYKEAGNE